MNPEEVSVPLETGKTLHLTYQELNEIRGSEMTDILKEGYKKQLENRTKNFFDFSSEELFFDTKNNIVTLMQQMGEYPYGVPYLGFKKPNFRGDSFFANRNREDFSDYWELNLSSYVSREPIDRAKYDDVKGIARLVQRLKDTSAELLAIEKTLLDENKKHSLYDYTGSSLNVEEVEKILEKSKELPDIDYTKIAPASEKGYLICKVNIVDPKTMRLVEIPGLALLSHSYNTLQNIDKDIRSLGYTPVKKKDSSISRGERLLTTRRWANFVGRIPQGVSSALIFTSVEEETKATDKKMARAKSRVVSYTGAFGILNDIPITLKQRELILPVLQDSNLSPWEKSITINNLVFDC